LQGAGAGGRWQGAGGRFFGHTHRGLSGVGFFFGCLRGWRGAIDWQVGIA